MFTLSHLKKVFGALGVVLLLGYHHACGRLLRIEWAVRSLVCSCGARVNVRPAEHKPAVGK